MSEMIKRPALDEIRPHLNEIEKRLWSGHAAVMVGSGFSRNAIPNSPSCLEFPEWSQLGDLFYEKIHGKKPDNKSKYLSVPKLAQQVNDAFGRPVLYQLICEAIPNDDYRPSPLHSKLLNLPWIEVFTTNYDTLLERTCYADEVRSYNVVVNQEGLTQKPRIIKLHGSLPSGPFVITEEDYRCYPENFALFVNTVRQAFLEYTLCLIGFSGDDPNFLQWVGWIRDNLGQNARKIYLISLSLLSDIEKSYYAKNNIVLVDLSKYPDINNHYEALEKFFDDMSEYPDTIGSHSEQSKHILDDSPNEISSPHYTSNLGR